MGSGKTQNKSVIYPVLLLQALPLFACTAWSWRVSVSQPGEIRNIQRRDLYKELQQVICRNKKAAS